ncbi:site-specific integrase [Vibrio harveyi]|uniref:site-specific integrase n=1 Tax=Vibrio harveyi TaxID=669 RepID=UPI002ED0D52F|nr:site-specific integrase [Vibrio harveyi]
MRYLHISKSGIWQFRYQVSPHHRHLFGDRREIKRSLKTSDKAEATIMALELEIQVRKTILTPAASTSFDKHLSTSSISQVKTPSTTEVSCYDALERFCKYKAQHISSKAVTMLEAKCRIVLDLIGKPQLRAIRRSDAEEVASLLRNYPTNLKKHKQFKGLSDHDAVELNKSLGLPTLSDESVKDYCQKMSGFFEWCVQMELTDVNPFKGFKFSSDKKISQSKHAYSNEDLRKLFSSSIYLNHDFKHPYQFWLPLLGLYTGARLNELCQLHTNDVVKINNVWCISINSDTSDKRLKNVNSERLIPIHRTLKELGFIDFAKKRPSQRIFDELKLERDGYGTSPSKWFGRYKSSLGFTRGYDFHSLRHTFASSLKNALIPEVLANELLGHTQSTISYERYGKEIDISTKADAVNSISSISSKHIKRFF